MKIETWEVRMDGQIVPSDGPSAEAQAIAEALSEKLNDLWPSDMVPLIADALEDYAARKVATQPEGAPSDGAIYAAHSRRQFSDEENAIFDEALSKVGRVIHEGEIVPTRTEDLGMSDDNTDAYNRIMARHAAIRAQHDGDAEPSAEALNAARQMFPMQNLAEDFYDRVAKSMDAYAARKVAVAVAAEREKASKVIRDWISEQKRTGADEWHSYGFNYFEALAAAICTDEAVATSSAGTAGIGHRFADKIINLIRPALLPALIDDTLHAVITSVVADVLAEARRAEREAQEAVT